MAQYDSPEDVYNEGAKQKRSLDDFYKKNREREREEKAKLDRFYESTRDSERGIQNVERTIRSRSPVPEDESRVGPRQREFEEEESVAARAYGKRAKRKGRAEEGEDSDGLVEEARAEYAHYNTARSAYARYAEHRSRLGALREAGAVAKVKKLSNFAKWSGLGIAFKVYVFQLLFAIVSLVGFGLQALVEDYKANSFWGKVIGFVVDFDKYFPGSSIGVAFWVLSMILVVASFLAYFLWYEFTGIRVFGTSISMLVTIVCFSLGLLPVTNLIPWVVVWVAYINTSTLFSTA